MEPQLVNEHVNKKCSGQSEKANFSGELLLVHLLSNKATWYPMFDEDRHTIRCSMCECPLPQARSR